MYFCFIEKHCLKRNFKNSRPICYIYTMFFCNTWLGTVLFYGLKRTLDIHKECIRRGYGIVRLDGGVNILYECMAYCGLRNSVNSDTDNYTQEFLQKSKGICGNIGAGFGYCRTWRCALFCLWDKHIIRFVFQILRKGDEYEK